MINRRNISGLFLVLAYAIYLTFGKTGYGSDEVSSHTIELWDSYYFCIWNYGVLYFGNLIVKAYKDKIINILMKVLMGVSFIQLSLNLYSFFDMMIFDKINTSSITGAIIVSCIVVFLIYRRNGMDKS